MSRVMSDELLPFAGEMPRCWNARSTWRVTTSTTSLWRIDGPALSLIGESRFLCSFMTSRAQACALELAR